jgi:hypothetical protein
MKIERYEDETDEEWDERLAEEISNADDYTKSQYFVERDPYNEENIIINYVTPDAFSWKEHPEGPFSCKQIMEWKQKYHLWEKLMSFGSEAEALADFLQWLFEHITVGEEQ